VGTEHEKIGLHVDDLSPVAFEGPRGIGALLERIASSEQDWKRVYEGDSVIALLREGASITLEPGGQVELSGAPLRTIHETCAEFTSHLAMMKRVSEPLGIVWLGLGIHPFHSVDQLPVMPKERYRIMRRYMPTRDSMGLVMMFATATVQANFDFENEADMVEKMRLANAVSPVVSAIFANASLSEHAANGFVSRRLEAWEHTDPDRTGLLPLVFEPDFGYRRYVDWALDVPMYFIVRDGEYLPAHHLTFRKFMNKGHAEVRATLKDFDTHLTTLFPDVRLKQIIEVRGADAVPRELTCSLPALWKGFLYDAEARRAAWDLVSAAVDPKLETLRRARAEVARLGLAARFGGRSILDVAKELAEISRSGLRRIAHAGTVDADETQYLDPIFEQLELGMSPGQLVLERWEGEWAHSVDRLVDYARY
jgi:glutamate--cysteine ligase